MLQPLTRSATQVQLRFTASAGAHSIQRADSVQGPWPEIGTATVGADGAATYTDNTAPSAAAFYRIRSR